MRPPSTLRQGGNQSPIIGFGHGWGPPADGGPGRVAGQPKFSEICFENIGSAHVRRSVAEASAVIMKIRCGLD